MSLVSEALRKARAGSPDPGAHRHGVVYRTTVVLGEGRRPGRGWRMLAVVLAAAAAGGAGAWWLLGRAPARPLAPPRPEAAAVTQPAEPAAAARITGAPATAAPAAAGAATAGPPPQPGAAASAPAVQAPAAPPPGPSPAAPRHAGLAAITAPAAPPAAAPAERAAPPPAAKPAAPAAAAPPAGGVRTFGLDADLGYAKLHLDYIVYRSKDPFAGINGQQVVIGSIVQGFTVEEIGPDSIRLHGPRGEVVLRIPH